MRMFSEFLQTIRKFGLEYYNRYYSVYPAIVVDNKDPDMRGRVKIQLPTILGTGNTHSAWAEPHGWDLAGKGTGAFFPPYVNDLIDVYFENGDLNFPIYKGGTYAEEELADDFTSSYPNVKGWKFKSGQTITIDETDGKLKISILNGNNTGGFVILDDTTGSEGIYVTHNTGSQMQFQKDGSIILASKAGNLVFLDDTNKALTLTSAAGVVFSIGDKLMFADATGGNIVNITNKTVEITASSDVVLTAPNVNVNSGNINLGNNAQDNAVLYSKIKAIIDSLIFLTPLGPTGPLLPTTTVAFAELTPATSAKAGNINLKGNT